MMTNHITSKVAYIPLEYHMSVEDFLEVWKDMEMEEEPTQEDYDAFILERGKSYFYDMRGEFERHIRLENTWGMRTYDRTYEHQKDFLMMTDTELYEMMNRMESFGGSFVIALAGAMRKADSFNKNKLIHAFPEYVKEYGPESKFPVQK